jgi:hypothetical protein
MLKSLVPFDRSLFLREVDRDEVDVDCCHSNGLGVTSHVQITVESYMGNMSPLPEAFLPELPPLL